MLKSFPKQLSGGQFQRVVIAIAITKKTKLLLIR
ncbi:MAG: ATP-binding cassette domain-containing protein [Halarcobacter ebronensis]